MPMVARVDRLVTYLGAPTNYVSFNSIPGNLFRTFERQEEIFGLLQKN